MGAASQGNMYALRLVLFSLAFLFFLHFGETYTWYNGEQRLTEFQSKYANSKADIFFLMDNSGSLWSGGQNGFRDEKTFITSLLSKIKIAKPATRVAVIRFGDHATIDINYVSDITGLNNKCEFNERFAGVHYTGVMTNMNDAFSKVEEILFGAQSTNVRPWKVVNAQGVYVNKVVFLLTDGHYNDGGDPRSRIANIKGNSVEVFAVGVSGANPTFLQSVATTSAHYFYYSDFDKFRELATHIRGDPYQLDYDAEHVPAIKCRYTCDDHASCGCGLLSGRYVCICHAGYFGTGEAGKCTPCAPGTYKKYPGLAEKSCTKCPANSGSSKLGSITIQDCECKKGYEGTPASGSDCTIKQCLSLHVPDKGYTNPTNCGRNYGDTCTFHCPFDYELIGEKTRICTVRDDNTGGAFWTPSDITPDCKRIVCEQSRVPNAVAEYGNCNITDLRVGTNCTYKCSRGYRLVGSGVKICRVDETWSGEDTACEVVKCPPLNSLDLATVNDRDCLRRPMIFDSACRFDCPTGYKFNASRSQSSTWYCGVNGKWIGQNQVCEDEEPPKFTNCPKNNKVFPYNTTFRTNTARVEWEIPHYEDNSMLHDVNHKITLVEVKGYKSPREFTIGKHRIHYILTDKANNRAECEFDIEVSDNEPPYYTSCPDRIEEDFQGQPPNVLTMRVTWDDPVFKDNSGKDPTVLSNVPNGGDFKEGQTLVTYTATDVAGNKNVTCQFEVKLITPSCLLQKRPKNGALVCLTVPSLSCQALCRDGYDFAYQPQYLYYCVNTAWMYWPPFPFGAPTVWPDCARREDPSSGSLKMSSAYYFKGDCNDKEVQAKLKDNYITVVSDPIKFPQSFCNMNNNCKLANLKVYCGEVDASRRRRRRRRSVEMEFRIQADFTVTPTTAVASQEDFQNLKSEMRRTYYGEVTNNVNNINWKQEMKMDLVNSPVVQAPEPYCLRNKGAVVGKCNNIRRHCETGQQYPMDPECLCNRETGSIEKCIECPIGKYLDVVDGKCKLCANGFYQDVEGQFGCKKCQPGFFTLGNDEKNFTSCKEICKPGYFSKTGLGPCQPCGLGNYTTRTWSKLCKICPTGTTTVLPAATKLEDCGMQCAPGTFSSNGVEPCKPCKKGFFQPEAGKLNCLPCAEKKSTYGPGAKSEAQCLEINMCASNPCNNGGHCFNAKDDYECVCLDGFSGKNCDDEVSQCLSHPCYRNALCVDKINGYECLCPPGFGGVNCDEPLPQFASNPCRNNAQCIEAAGAFECKCQDGWTGKFCEVNRDDCYKKPCKNNGICRDQLDGFRCECVAGFTGDNCEINIDECASDPCGPNGRCEDKVSGYICHCSAGWAGITCQTEVTPCSTAPCQRGKCVVKDRYFECQCPPNFGGNGKCNTEYSSDFDLSFTTSQVRTFSKRALHTDLHAFTVAFWMRSGDDENAGTPISYAVKRDQYVQENGLVLKDYGNLAIQINNQTGYTGGRLNDGHWHHVAITWKSDHGRWVYYRDGKEVKRATDPIAQGDFIRGGGHFVLAQEQDWDTEEKQFTYNPYEAFIGDMSQMTVWNTVLSSQDIYNLAGSCLNSRNDALVVSWGDFVPELTGDYRKTTESSACRFNHELRWYTTVYNAVLPSNNNITVNNIDLIGCARKCYAMPPGVQCRSFEYHASSQTCYLSKANRETVAVSHPANSGHDYYELNCVDMLGVESGVILDSQMTASSQHSSLSGAKHGRANGRKASNVNGMPDSDGGWIPSHSNQNQYLQIDLGSRMKVTAVETQGADGHDYWVQSYQIQTSISGSSWSTLSETFPGNTDNIGRKKNQIGAEARYIRFIPISWHNAIGMRVEVYGCSLNPEGAPSDLSSITATNSGSCSPNPCQNSGVCTPVPYGYVCKCPIGYSGDNCQHEVDCNTPGTPVNGAATISGKTVHYTCNPGFRRVGISSMTCLGGMWSAVAPTCENIDECATNTAGCNQHCTDFPGTYKCSCVDGYRLGDDKKTCIDIDECAENVCSHGCVNRPGSFRCTCPFKMVLRKSLTRCEDVDECASRNGGCAHLCLDTYLGHTCFCKHGYTPGSGIDVASCKEITCPSLSNPPHGTYSMNGEGVLGNTASFSCQDGFKLVGSDQRICMADKKWSGVQPECKPVKCVNIGTVDHANRQLSGSGNDYGNVATFTCHPTYRLLGTGSRTCDKTSTWTGEQPICIPNYCPKLDAPAHGKINGFRTELGAIVGISCDVGYAIHGGSPFRKCLQTQQWSGVHPTCQLVDCGDPGIPRHGYRHGNHYQYNATINFSCKDKHHLEGARIIKCQANGKWSSPAPECLARSCGNPGVPYNGFKHGDAHTYGKQVSYSCQQGYIRVGDRVRTCEQSTATWTGSLPSCQLTSCGEVAAPANGFRVGSEFTYKKVLAFDCDPGYKLVGNQIRECQENGLWSGSPPTCVATSCGSFMHGPSGEVESPNYPSPYENNVYCTWKITVPAGKKVRIDFSDFKTESWKDFVYVFDTDSTEPILTFSGVGFLPRPVISTGNSLRIRFVSNGVTRSKGFHLTYSQVDCGGMLTAPTGSIMSPAFKGQYPSNLECIWLIHLPRERVQLTFSDFNTQQSYDRVEIFRGAKSTDGRLVNLSGVLLPHGFFVTNEYMYVRFTSSAQNDQSYYGFRALYEKYMY